MKDIYNYTMSYRKWATQFLKSCCEILHINSFQENLSFKIFNLICIFLFLSSAEGKAANYSISI